MSFLKMSSTTITTPRNTHEMIKWVRSWKGLEDDRRKLRETAHRVVETDARVRELYPSSVASGFICEAMRELHLARSPEIRAAAMAQVELDELNVMLIDERHLEFDFVRREWATILDPSPEEAALCERLALAGEKDDDWMLTDDEFSAVDED